MCGSEEDKKEWEEQNCYASEEFLVKRKSIRISALIFGIVFILLGILSIFMWSLMLSMSWDVRGSPITSSAGIWGGALNFITGAFGILVFVQKKYHWLAGHFWSCIGCIGGWANYVRLALEAWNRCDPSRAKDPIPAACLPNDPNLFGLAHIAFLFSVLTCLMIIPVLIYFLYVTILTCKHYKKSKNEVQPQEKVAPQEQESA